MSLPTLPNIGVAWLGFDPQLNSDESRASSSCSSGSACLQHLLLGLLQLTALSHSSRSHNFRPGCTLCHHLPHHLLLSSSTTICLSPPLISLSLLTFSTQKRPKCALLCLVGSKTPLWLWVAHFTWQPGSCCSTTKVRTFSFPVVPVRESNWLHRAARRLSRAGSGLGPDRHSPPDQIRYSNGTRQALFFS